MSSARSFFGPRSLLVFAAAIITSALLALPLFAEAQTTSNILKLISVPRYTPPVASPVLTLFPPNPMKNGRPKGMPAEIVSSWFSGMPSPAINCDDADGNETDLCLDKDFEDTASVRVASIMAVPRIAPSQMGTLTTPRLGLDLVSYRGASRRTTVGSGRGQQSRTMSAVEWAYATAPTNNANANVSFKVPKGTQVDLSYACQPNHTHSHRTKTTCFLFIGSCNIADHNSIFRLADRAKINGTNSSVLHRTETKTITGPETFTLQCGGYRPEAGTQANGGLPPSYDKTNVHRGNDWFHDHPDTHRFLNAIDPAYYQPQISLTVEGCTGDNEIVRTVGGTQTCVPCAAPTPYRAGNICVSNLPPTATLRANGAPDGQSITVAPGTRVNIVAAYTPAAGDQLTATAINDQATGNSVSCNSVTPRTSQCWTRADASKTYTFTPRSRDVGRTFTFAAQIRTTIYPTYATYKTVSVTVSDGTGCPSNATQNPDGSCTCTQQYYTFAGGSCVLFCPPTMEPDGMGSCGPAIPPLPRPEDITFEAERVRSGQPSTLSFTIAGMAVGITCNISPTPASGQIVWNSQTVWSSTAETPAITQPTQYTLRCENGRDTPVAKTVTVQLIPEFQEI